MSQVSGLRSTHAAVTLNVSGLRGGSTILDLGELGRSQLITHEEATIDMTATPAASYQLTQALSSPLVNERGVALEAVAIQQEVIGGSSGTVRVRGATPLSSGTTELFTSNASGQSETLTVIYSVSISTFPQTGTYRGAITYTLQGADGSLVETKTMPMRLIVQPVAALEFAEGLLDQLLFRALEPGEVSVPQRIGFVIRSNIPGPFRVTHAVEGELLNEEGRPFPLSAVRVSVAAEDGARKADGTLESSADLSLSEPEVAGVSPLGWSYQVQVPEQQPAGVYQGTVRLGLVGPAVEGGSPPPLLVPVTVEVLPVLSLTIQSAEGEDVALTFSSLTPGEPGPTYTLRFDILANLGKPYAVFQEMAHRLVDRDGHQLSDEVFRCVGSGAQYGTLHLVHDAEVPAGKYLLYQSDASGSPDSFLVNYTLHIPPETPAGTYQSSLLFTVTPF